MTALGVAWYGSNGSVNRGVPHIVSQLRGMTGNGMRHSKGPKVGLEPWPTAEDKASAHGTCTLPTELMPPPSAVLQLITSSENE